MEIKNDVEYIKAYCKAIAAGPGCILYGSYFGFNIEKELFDRHRGLMRYVENLLKDMKRELKNFSYEIKFNESKTFLLDMKISLDNGKKWIIVADNGNLIY